MDKHKIRNYIVLLVLLFAGSLLLPYAINAASGALVNQILKQTESSKETIAFDETETETETESSDINTEGTVTVTAVGQETCADTMVEADADNSEETVSPETMETQSSSEAKSEEISAEQSERLDDMANYVENFMPEIIYNDAAGTAETDFIGGREDKFVEAIGNYLYSLYDDWVTVVRIEIVEETRNDDDVCSCRIILYADDGNNEEFLCNYNKKYDFYGIYTIDSTETEEE